MVTALETFLRETKTGSGFSFSGTESRKPFATFHQEHQPLHRDHSPRQLPPDLRLGDSPGLCYRGLHQHLALRLSADGRQQVATTAQVAAGAGRRGRGGSEIGQLPVSPGQVVKGVKGSADSTAGKRKIQVLIFFFPVTKSQEAFPTFTNNADAVEGRGLVLT